MTEEKFISGNSFIHKLDPKARILASIVLSFAAALCNHIFIAVCYLTISFVLLAMAKLNARDILARIKPVFWFLLMIWILLPITFEGAALYQFYGLKISSAGVMLCLKITVKSITILLLFTALVATMSIGCLGNTLHKLYVPDKMVFLILMSYRYIAVIEEEYLKLLRAAKFRGFSPGTNLHSYKTFAYLAGMLFVRASLRAKRVHQAMLCRGFKNKFYTIDVFYAGKSNWIFLTCVLFAGSTLVIVENIWI